MDIGTRNNCPKSNIPTLTIFYCINLRQMQKDVDKEILNYVDMKISAQVNRIRNPSESEIRETKNEDPDSEFVYFTFPTYEGSKLLGVEDAVLEDPGVVFFDNGFYDVDEKKSLLSCQKRKKLPNSFSCTAPSFMKRPIKENAYNCDNRSHICCYTPQLCNQAEETNMHNKKPFVLFIQVGEEFFGIDFVPTDLVGSDPERKLSARQDVRNIAKMMCKENQPRITQNLKNVAKRLPSDRICIICSEKFNDFSNSRFVLE